MQIGIWVDLINGVIVMRNHTDGICTVMDGGSMIISEKASIFVMLVRFIKGIMRGKDYNNMAEERIDQFHKP